MLKHHPSRLLASSVMLALSTSVSTAVMAAPSGVLEEVVVTASKRAENLLDVPAAITVLGGELIEAQGISNFEDYFDQVPGLSLVSNGQPGRGIVSLRGISTGATQTSATVGWYLDDVQFGSSGSLAIGGTYLPDPDLFDVSRIEVLKGPQGTLYGAATLGGLIKVVRNAPDPARFDAKISLEGNSVSKGGEGYAARAMINAPVSESSAIRAVVTTRQDAGFIDNLQRNVKDENQTNVYSGRVAWLYRPSDEFSVELSTFYQNSETDGVNQTDLDPVTLDPTNGELSTAENFVPTGNDTEYQVNAAKFDIDVGFATFTSITSLATSQDDSTVDITNNVGFGIVLPYNQQIGFDKWNQEFRLTSREDERFEWLLGAFYTNEKNDWDFDILGHDPVTLEPLVPTLNAYTFIADTKYTETAGFATGTVHLGSAVDVVFGGRYSKNDQSYTYNRSGIFNGGISTTTTGKSSDDPFNYAVSLQWRPIGEAMLYARIATGYRPGGPQVSNLTGLGLPTTYDPDTVDNYEIGAKGTALDGLLKYDLAIFRINWTDIQLLKTVVVNTPSGPVRRSLIDNAGKASSTGAEAALQWAPTESLVLGGSIAYMDAQLDSPAPAIGGAKGDRIPYSPEWSGTLDADYSQEMTGSVIASFGASLRYMGERDNYFAADPAGNVQATMPSFTTFDLRASLFWQDWTFGLRLDNATDERGIISAQTNAFETVPPYGVANDAGAFIQPRTFAITVSRDF